jgi:NhaP-type Na+/H+ or K+/H+ antiporter
MHLPDLSAVFAGRPSLLLLVMVVEILVVGLAAQIAAYRLGLPSIVMLLLAGLALGPDGLGAIQPAPFGVGLRTIVTACVALIVFESVLRIDIHQLRQVTRPVAALSTLGVAITTCCAAAVGHWVAGLPWEPAWLFGAIASITGPTVIIPIVRRLALPPQVKATLEGESVFADAVGVLLAATIFGFISAEHANAANGVLIFAGRLLTGTLVGITTALTGRWLITRLLPLPGEYVRLAALGIALTAYTAADMLTRNLGILAVAVAAIVVGLRPLPYTATIKQFKGDLTLIALGMVFMLLAAKLQIGQVMALGWGGLATVAILMVVVRPLCIFVSTAGSGLTPREKAFMAALGPRGIVAASAATFFALELDGLGLGGGEGLKALVFLLVILTVTIEGGGAPWVARRLGVIPRNTVVLGGDLAVRHYAKALVARGEAVQVWDEAIDRIHDLMDHGLPSRYMALDRRDRVLASLRRANARALVVATDDAERNLALAVWLREHLPDLPIVVRTSQPDLTDLGLASWSAPEIRPEALAREGLG